MGQLRTIQIFVVGHARRPGAYTVSSLSTLVNAVFAKAAQTGAALLAVPVTDTVKQVNAQHQVTATQPRQGLWLAHPQRLFRTAVSPRHQASNAPTNNTHWLATHAKYPSRNSILPPTKTRATFSFPT